MNSLHKESYFTLKGLQTSSFPGSMNSHFLSFTSFLMETLNFIRFAMGNKPARPKKEEVLLMIVPPVDQAYARWLARDLERIHRFVPRNPRAIKPPEHYIEYMRLNGWLDLDLDDPDLAHLFK